MNNYKFIHHKSVNFPLSSNGKIEDCLCMFCYCPLYMLGDKCGGNFKYTPHGIKDCSNCILPHIKEVGYAHIQKKMLEVIEIVQQEHLAKKEEK